MKLIQTASFVLLGSVTASAQTTVAPDANATAPVANETDAGFGSEISDFVSGVANTTGDFISGAVDSVTSNATNDAGYQEWLDGMTANMTDAGLDATLGADEEAAETAEDIAEEAAEGAEEAADVNPAAVRFVTISAIAASAFSAFVSL